MSRYLSGIIQSTLLGHVLMFHELSRRGVPQRTLHLDSVLEAMQGRGMVDHLRNLGPFSDRPELDILAFRFFKQFSRMEYALKAAEKFKNGRAEADWLAFANEIDEAFTEKRKTQPELRRAYSYVMSEPPLKQTIDSGRLIWIESTPDAKTDTALVLQYVCRIRNNLFHGGKFSSGWLDPERSERLLGHALLILESCIDIPSPVANAYET